MTVQEGVLLCGRYRLQQSIGRGGMADVFMAFDKKRQAPVAVKILREDMAEEPDLVRRFGHEAQALARLDHPNIVHFYAFEQDGPVAFIVMDYIEGTTLRGLLNVRRKSLDVKEITSILRDLCSALHYAHLNGFIHRDLKPGNIMLKQDGKALLTDFGISRATEGVTLTGEVVGTPAYMSPEQVTGGQVDARSDIYSLGALLFEMATGRRPFTGEEPGLTLTGTNTRIQEAHLRLTPPDPRIFNGRLPPAAAKVILRSLAKNSADRWPDVVSLRQAWEAAVGAASTFDDADVPARDIPPPGKITPVHPPAQHIGFPRGALILLGLVIVVAAVVWVAALRPLRMAQTVPQHVAEPSRAAVEAVAHVQTRLPTATRRPNATGSGGVQVVPPPQTRIASDLPVTTAAQPLSGTPGPPAAGAGSAPTSGQPTLVPTRTMEPTSAPTAVPTAVPTAAPNTATPRPARTPQPTPASKAVYSSGGVDLLHPPDGERIGDGVMFEWQSQPGFALRADERYELIIWGLDEDPMRDGRSPVGAGDVSRVSADLAVVEGVLRLSPGKTYYWGVALLASDGKRVRMLSDGRKFSYERPSSEGGSTSPGCVGPDCEK